MKRFFNRCKYNIKLIFLAIWMDLSYVFKQIVLGLAFVFASGLFWMFAILIGIGVGVGVPAYYAANQPSWERRYDNVVRVYYHTTDSYSVLSEEGNELVMHNLSHRVKIIRDVPADKPMYAFHSYKQYRSPEYYGEIHVHKAQDIDGGSFKRQTGKMSFRTEFTEVIE